MNSRTSYNSLRLFGFCIVWLLISVQSWGQEAGCTSGNCVNGQGTYTFPDEAIKEAAHWYNECYSETEGFQPMTENLSLLSSSDGVAAARRIIGDTAAA